MNRFVAADRLEVEEEKEVDRGHGGWDVGIRLQSAAVAVLIGLHNRLLRFAARLRVLGIAEHLAVETENGGAFDVEEGRGFRSFVLRIKGWVCLVELLASKAVLAITK